MNIGSSHRTASPEPLAATSPEPGEAPHEGHQPGEVDDAHNDSAESGQLATQTHRFTAVIALVIALGLVAIAWYAHDRGGGKSTGEIGESLRLLPRIGQPAPDFAVKTATDGQPVRLSAYRGRPVWLNFWGSWCPPCRKEMPELEAAYENLHSQGMELLAVSLFEPATDAVTFAARNHVTYTVLSDPDGTATGRAYPIADFPTHILIDRNGIVRDVVIGAIDRKEIEQHARKILPPQP